MPGRIDVLNRVIVHPGVSIPSLGISRLGDEAVRLDPAVKIRVVESSIGEIQFTIFRWGLSRDSFDINNL
jgi:hypothetical protein